MLLAWNAHPETISWVASEGYDDIHHYGGGRGGRFRICLSWSVHSFASQAFLPSSALLEQKSEPTDPGCWRRVKESTDCVSNQQKRYF